MSSTAMTGGENFHRNKDNMLEELKKLRNANKLAEELLNNIAQSKGKSAVESNDATNLTPVIPCHGRDNDGTNDLDIWGAKQYLEKCESLSYVEEYMRRSQLVLQKTKKLIPLSKPTSYEVVADVCALHHGSHTDRVDSVQASIDEKDKDTTALITNDTIGKCSSKHVCGDSEKIPDTEMKNRHVLDSSMTMFNRPKEHVNPCNGVVKYCNDDHEKDVATSDSENHVTTTTKKYKVSEDLNHCEMRLQETNVHDLKYNTVTIASSQDMRPQIRCSPPSSQTDFKHDPVKKVYNLRSSDVRNVNIIDDSNSGSSGELMRPFLNLLLDRNLMDDNLDTTTKDQDSCHSSFSNCLSMAQCDSLNGEGEPTDSNLPSKFPITEHNTPSKAKTSWLIPQELSPAEQKADSCNSKKEENELNCHDQKTTSNKISTTSTIQYAFDHQDYITTGQRNYRIGRPVPSTGYTHLTIMISNNIETVPDEIMLKIFTYLPRKDLENASLVCKRFNKISKDPDLWMSAEANGIVVSDKWFDSLKHRKPRSLVLQNCPAQNLSSKGLRSFFQSCKNSLKHVHVSGCKHRLLCGDNILLHVTSHCNMTSTVSLPWSNTTNNGLSALACSNIILEELDINGNCFVSDESFIPLLSANNGSLRSLKVNGCFTLSCEGFIAVSQFCPNLEILHMGLCSKVTTQCIQDVCTTLKNLRSLDLRSLKSVTGECICAISKHCKHLVGIVLANCTLLDDNCIAQVTSNLPALTILDISGCIKLTDRGVGSLAVNLVAPKELNLSSTAISYQSVYILTENCFDSLTTLKLSFCNNITNDSITKLISFCYNLSCLHLHGCKRIIVPELHSGNNSSLRISL